jgi:hypothetical protein
LKLYDFLENFFAIYPLLTDGRTEASFNTYARNTA